MARKEESESWRRLASDPLNKTFVDDEGVKHRISDFIDYQGTNLDPVEAVRRGAVYQNPKKVFLTWYHGAALHIHDQDLHEACKALLGVGTWTNLHQWLAVDVVASVYRTRIEPCNQ